MNLTDKEILDWIDETFRLGKFRVMTGFRLSPIEVQWEHPFPDEDNGGWYFASGYDVREAIKNAIKTENRE